MANADTVITRLADGTLLLRRADGSYRPVPSATDHQRLNRLTDQEIEVIAATDPDHPALGEAFWQTVDASAERTPVSIELDRDVSDFFQQQGGGLSRQVNEVLRDYVEKKKRAG